MRTVQVIELFHQKKSWNGPTVYIFYKKKGKKKLRIEKSGTVTLPWMLRFMSSHVVYFYVAFRIQVLSTEYVQIL